MWGNLADRLGSTDINATLEKIGNAVAPREDCDDEDDSSGDYDDYCDEEEYYGHDTGEGIINKVAGASPFRLAGILTRALDGGNQEIGNMEESDKNSYSDDKNTTRNIRRESIQKDEETFRNGHKHDTGIDCHVEELKQTGDTFQGADKNVRDSSQLLSTNLHQSFEDEHMNPRSEDTPIDINGSTGQQSMEALRESIDDTSKVVDVATEFKKSEEKETEKDPKQSHTTAKETKASLSPIEMKTKIVSSTISNDAGRANSVKDQAFTIDKSLKRNKETTVDVKKSISKQSLDLKDCRDNIPTRFSNVDIPVAMGNYTNEKEKKVVLNIKCRKIAKEAPLVSTANVTVNVDTKKAKKIPRVVENVLNVNLMTNTEPKASTPELTETIEKQAVSSFSDTNEVEEAKNLSGVSGPKYIEKNDDGDGDFGNSMKALSVGSNKLIKKISNSTPSSDNSTLRQIANQESDVKSLNIKKGVEQKLPASDSNCTELQTQLVAAKQAIEGLKNQARRDKEKAQSEREDLIAQFHSKEARLLEATSEENQNQTLLLQQEYSSKIQKLEHSLVKERREEQGEYKRLLRESYSNIDRMESELRTIVNKHEKEIAQVQQREERATRKVDDRMAQTMAVLDERDEEIKSLKKSINNMKSRVNEHQEGEEEAEEELEEVHQENDSLRQTIEKLELEKKNLKEQVATLKSGTEEVSGLRMELTMLKEEYNRERTKNQTVVDSAISSRSQLETERDNALSELRDSKQQLAATLGDLEISRTDYSRIVMANNNLQCALEAFQDERQAEMEMVDEQRRESEEAIESAHATATSALKQIHETEMYNIQKASDNAVKNVMHEMELVESNLEKLKSENNQMRRSLDEAIYRLQTTQEDVIDRNVMKNILLDWCTLSDKSKRHQVLQVMANLLHFSEEEKEKVHLTSKSLDSVRAKVVGALAAPLPPSKADVEHLEGNNVHEKWVNFLLAETEDA